MEAPRSGRVRERLKKRRPQLIKCPIVTVLGKSFIRQTGHRHPSRFQFADRWALFVSVLGMIERILARRDIEGMVSSAGKRTNGINRAAGTVEERTGYVGGLLFEHRERRNDINVLSELFNEGSLLGGRKARLNESGNQQHLLRAGANRNVAAERTALSTSQGACIRSRAFVRVEICGMIILAERTKKIIRILCGTNGVGEFLVEGHRVISPNVLDVPRPSAARLVQQHEA